MMHLERLNKTGTENWSHIEDDGCTAYAKQRMQEDNGEGAFKMFPNRTVNGYPVAKEWFGSWLFNKGQTPKVGAIACWDGEYGHVAYVEKVNDDGSITVSQSNAFGVKWELKTYLCQKGQITEGAGLVFQGYCYNPKPIDNRLSEVAGDCVEVIGDLVRARKSPNGEAYAGRYIPHGIFKVHEMKSEGGFTWVRLDDDVWMALGSWSILHSSEQPKNDENDWRKAIDTAIDSLVRELEKEKSARKTAEDQLKKVRDIING